MTRFIVAVLVLAVLPSLAAAQRRAGMGGSKDADFGFAGAAAAGPSITGRDLEKASPLTFLIDKKKDLKLNDVQLATIKSSEGKLRDANVERYKAIDSLKKQLRPGSSAEDEARVAIARDALMDVVKEIRASYDSAAKESVNALDEPQQRTAQELLSKHGEEMQQMLREKLGGHGGRGGRPPRG